MIFQKDIYYYITFDECLDFNLQTILVTQKSQSWFLSSILIKSNVSPFSQSYIYYEKHKMYSVHLY